MKTVPATLVFLAMVILALSSSGADDAVVLLPQTGQETAFAAGDDGNLKKGVAWPSPRLHDNGDGTVTDRVTGLVWLKDAHCLGSKTWVAALSSVGSLAHGTCGLADHSVAGHWRLPNVNELESLLDRSKSFPALPANHPFTGVQNNPYWSSTTFASTLVKAYEVNLGNGYVGSYDKASNNAVWPVK